MELIFPCKILAVIDLFPIMKWIIFTHIVCIIIINYKFVKSISFILFKYHPFKDTDMTVGPIVLRPLSCVKSSSMIKYISGSPFVMVGSLLSFRTI